MKEGFGKHWRSRWWLAGAVGTVSKGSGPGRAGDSLLSQGVSGERLGVKSPAPACSHVVWVTAVTLQGAGLVLRQLVSFKFPSWLGHP